MKRGDRLLILILLIGLIGSGVYVFAMNNRAGSRVAVIKQNGVVIREIDLDAVTEPFEFRVEDGQGGYNVIAVERGRIRVIEANCPEQVDVKQGWISAPHQSLVCLPHRLVIEIQSGEAPEVDGIVQ
ncbi:MAG: NusG domain II-containing protein [Bacillota bacterium]|jgi:hypothetical protein